MTAHGLQSLQRWLTHEPAGVVLELVCAEHAGAGRGASGRTVVQLATCLAEVDVGEVVELLLVGPSAVHVRIDECAEPGRVEAAIGRAASVLRAGGVDRLHVEGVAAGGQPRAHRRAVLDVGQLPVSRRRLFGLDSGAERTMPPPATDPHARLVAALRAVIPATTPGLAELTAPAVRLGATGCTMCGVCVRSCPEGALALHDGAAGGTVAVSTLAQSPSACSGCLRCVELCPEDALEAVGTWSWAEMLDDREVGVVSRTTAVCARCSTRFPTSSGERWCPVCAFKRAHPFGSTLPPGATLPEPAAGAGA